MTTRPKNHTPGDSEEEREGWHRHANGGGWVQDTAAVDPAAWVGPKGTIHGGDIRGGTIWGGTIHGGTIWGGTIRGGTIRGGTIWGGTIRGGTIWGGTIWGGTIRGGDIWGGTIRGGDIHGGTIWGGTIWGGTIKVSPLQIQGTCHFVTETRDGKVQIGCTELTLAEWRAKGAALARSERFTSAQVAEYGAYLDLFERLRPALSQGILSAQAAGAAKTEGEDVR